MIFISFLSQALLSQQVTDSIIVKMKDGNIHKFDISKDEDLKAYRRFNILSEEVKICINKTDSDTLYIKSEVMPEYPGGLDEFRNFVSKNLVYPNNAPKKSKGKGEIIYIQFIVTTNGDVKFHKVLKGETEVFITEAKRVLALSPKWKPGLVDNLPVDVFYVMPCVFSYK